MADNLWTAFIADNGSNDILATSSADGIAWTPGVSINQTSPYAPSLATYEGVLYCAFVTNDEDSATGVPSNRIFLTWTTDGVTWSQAIFFDQYSKCAPSLAVWNDKLHLAFVANDPSDRLIVYYSATPQNKDDWHEAAATGQTSTNAPALAGHSPQGGASQLYLAFVVKGSQDISVTSIASGGQWTPATVTKESCHFSPALAAFSGTLYMVFAAANGSKDLYLSSLQSNGTWSGSVPVNQSTSATPCAVGFGTNLAVLFDANSPSGEVLLVSNAHPTGNWPVNNVLLKQQSGQGPALETAPLTYEPVLPAPSAANDNYLITSYNQDSPLLNIAVTVTAVQDFVNTASYNAQGYKPVGSPITTGFSIQLNCQPPGTITGTGPYPGAGKAVWEQLGIDVEGKQVSMWYENSSSAGLGPTTTKNIFLLPEANTIPKGYKIEMKLETDASTTNVTKLSVNAWDAAGNAIKGGGGSSPVDGPWSLPVTSFPAPILNLQCNIGGEDNGQYAKFQAGSQSFPLLIVSYKADHDLMVRGATNLETAENSNLSFGLLAAKPTNPIEQTVRVS